MEPIPRHIAAITKPVDSLMTYYVLKALATTVAFPVMIVLLYFRYHTMKYVFSDEGVRMSWGILFRHEVILNYARIQDIHLRSNAIERWLGLARIEIQTASGGSSEMTLEGLTDHEAMRDFLYSRMRGASDKRHESPAATESERLATVLGEVAGELRAIRVALEGRRNA
jgi:putative membrane protein